MPNLLLPEKLISADCLNKRRTHTVPLLDLAIIQIIDLQIVREITYRNYREFLLLRPIDFQAEVGQKYLMALIDQQSEPERRDTRRWQEALKPLLILVLVSTGIFFFATSYLQYQRLENFVTGSIDNSELASTFSTYEKGQKAPLAIHYIQWKADLLVQEQRRAQVTRRASAVLLGSIWTQNLGFVTGMILAVLGASFIMAKLSEPTTSLEAEGAGAKASLTTASPGIVLAVLGTVLMIMAMSVKFSATIKDPIVVSPAENLTESSEDFLPPTDDFIGADETFNDHNKEDLPAAQPIDGD